jgi:hypothetical protein
MNTSPAESADQAKVGSEVVTVAALPGVPIGTRGRIVALDESEDSVWFARVQWQLPRKRSEIMALVGDISINIPWRARPVTAEFNKSEFERVFRPTEQDSCGSNQRMVASICVKPDSGTQCRSAFG